MIKFISNLGVRLGLKLQQCGKDVRSQSKLLIPFNFKKADTKLFIGKIHVHVGHKGNIFVI